MMNKTHTYLIVFFITIFTVMSGIYALNIYVASRDSDDYLASLRESSVFGCSTLGVRHPDILFIGNSHSYAGWNFNLVDRLLESRHISACMMGGFYLETALSLVQRIDSVGIYPKKLIFGASLLQFIEREDKQKQLVEHEKILKLIRASYVIPSFDMVRRDIDWILNPGSWATLQDVAEYHTPRVEAISETSALTLIENVPLDSASYMLKVAKNVRFSTGMPEKIAAFCSWIDTHGIELYVIDIPVSPYLEAQYKEKDIRSYKEIVELFRKCSKHVIQEGSRYYGLGNRHFINRSMLDDFPYEQLMEEPIHFPLHTDISQENLYNVDHMNLIGANRFTGIALGLLDLLPEQH